MRDKLLFIAQVTLVSWAKTARSGDAAIKRATALTHTQALPSSVSAPVTIELIECEESSGFSPTVTRAEQPFHQPPSLNVPFTFRPVDDGVQVTFNPDLEHADWRPARFHKPQQDGSTWQRPRQLFTLQKGQAGRFMINYYHGNRTATGASKAPQYIQIRGQFYCVGTEHLQADTFQFDLDETMILR